MIPFLPVAKPLPRYPVCSLSPHFLYVASCQVAQNPSGQLAPTSPPSPLVPATPQEMGQTPEAPYPNKIFLHVVMDQVNPDPFLSVVQALEGHLQGAMGQSVFPLQLCVDLPLTLAPVSSLLPKT